mmetsp:Transcript_21086/g.65943  ORF Transcript_21086/g.65943 Transcript_21086/m.65943 type:complete len:234 (-) Transcript_21086:1108-1809(-)
MFLFRFGSAPALWGVPPGAGYPAGLGMPPKPAASAPTPPAGAPKPPCAPKPPMAAPPAAGNCCMPGIAPPGAGAPKPGPGASPARPTFEEGILEAGAAGAAPDMPAKGSKVPGPSAAFAVAEVAKGSKLPFAEGAEGVGASKRPAPLAIKLGPPPAAAGEGDGPAGGGGAFGTTLAGALGAGIGFEAFAVPAKSSESKSCGSASLVGGAFVTVGDSIPPSACPASTCASFLTS